MNECSAGNDTVCEPLPDACIVAGQCAGLGLEDVPAAVWTNITSLNMSENSVFAVDRRVVTRFAGLTPSAM